MRGRTPEEELEIVKVAQAQSAAQAQARAKELNSPVKGEETDVPLFFARLPIGSGEPRTS
jgi:hypothetical protein